MSVLELVGPHVESLPREFSLAESHAVEACRAPRIHDDRLDHGHELGQLDGYSLRISRSQIDGHRLRTKAEMAREKHLGARRQLGHREFALVIGQGYLIHTNYFDSAAAVCGGAFEHHATRDRCDADLRSGI